VDDGRAFDENFAGDAGIRHARFLSVGTQKARSTVRKEWLDLPWQKVRVGGVKLFEQDGELYVLAKSEADKPKRLPCAQASPLAQKAAAMPGACLPGQLLMRLGAANRQLARLPVRAPASAVEAG